ncbi:hypothetical protein DFS34DRAFT_693672 [Phlyctochytrium arcticum]|nr:hypothetical protein DFS34DRAFT_693672 [Phlyctochytrium arcticum]
MIHEIILNSSFASSPTEPTWIFPNLNVQWFKIKEVIIPSSSVYTVNETNNKLVLYEDNGSKRTASIPNGYYNSVNIVPTLKTAMENVGDQGYDITFDNVTKKLTITSDAPFKIGNSQSGTTAWRVLGSEKDNSPNKATSYTFPYQVDLSNTSVLLLCSTSLNTATSFIISRIVIGFTVVLLFLNLIYHL